MFGNNKIPKWTAQISISSGEKFSFDGVKDMMKFYLIEIVMESIMI